MNRRVRMLSEMLRNTFGGRVQKVPIDMGATCPNRDGTLGWGGCTFCSLSRIEEMETTPLREQFDRFVDTNQFKKPSTFRLIYLQNYSNTYMDPDRLRRSIDEVLAYPQVIGVAIATRADCLTPMILDLLEEVSNRSFLWVELGLQTIHDQTLQRIGRGYDHSAFERGVYSLQTRKIPVVLHLMMGLPGEGVSQMLETIDYVANLRPFGIKIHSLFIERGTRLAMEYERAPFPILTKDAYTDLVVETIRRVPEDTVFHRLTGDANKNLLIEPQWSADKLSVIGLIYRKLKERDIIQGELWKNTH